MKRSDFEAAVREYGGTINQPKRHWKCRRFGCDLPEANVITRKPSGQGAESGIVGDVECRRCGRHVGPFDSDYPTIHPSGVYFA